MQLWQRITVVPGGRTGGMAAAPLQQDSQLLWRRSQAASDSAAAVSDASKCTSTSGYQCWEARRMVVQVASRLSLRTGGGVSMHCLGWQQA